MVEDPGARLEAIEFAIVLLLAKNLDEAALQARLEHMQRAYASPLARQKYGDDEHDIRWKAMRVRAIMELLERALDRHRRAGDINESRDALDEPPPIEFFASAPPGEHQL